MIIDLEPIFRFLIMLGLSWVLPFPVFYWLRGLAEEAQEKYNQHYNGRLVQLFRKPWAKFSITAVQIFVAVISQVVLQTVWHGPEKAFALGMAYVLTTLMGTAIVATVQGVRAAARWFQRVAVVGKPVETEDGK